MKILPNKRLDAVITNKRMDPAAPIYFVSEENWAETAEILGPAALHFAKAADYVPKMGKPLCLPDTDGNICGILTGSSLSTSSIEQIGSGDISNHLPAGNYYFAILDDKQLAFAALGWTLGAYKFQHYRNENTADNPVLIIENRDIFKETLRLSAGCYFLRDLVNMPPNDLGPQQLANAAVTLAGQFEAAISIIEGCQLEAQFPMIHAVGKASSRPPLLIDMSWGSETAPKVTLIGKGVCFDSGGLNIKPDGAMSLMKKDMGGGAHVLALSMMLMSVNAPIRLRVIIPAVENSISGAAFRPGDVLPSRAGISVEIGNTDAEGRLILADALDLAAEDEPDLIIDMATLTGAARVALGPDLPALFSGSDELATDLAKSADISGDPLWRLPLWAGYENMLQSKIADVNHISKGAFAGSVTAALFLQRFVPAPDKWAHLDIYAWNPSSKPAKPEGAEAQAIRALDHYIRSRFR